MFAAIHSVFSVRNLAGAFFLPREKYFLGLGAQWREVDVRTRLWLVAVLWRLFLPFVQRRCSHLTNMLPLNKERRSGVRALAGVRSGSVCMFRINAMIGEGGGMLRGAC